MFSKNKKYIVMGVMFALLIAVGVLNLVLNNNILNTGASQMTSAGFFVNHRQERISTRDREIVYLDAIIASKDSSSEIKLNAENRKMELIAGVKLEFDMESMIKAKGFEDVVVSFMTDYCNVIVKSSTLASEQITQIATIVSQQSKLEFKNIKITPMV